MSQASVCGVEKQIGGLLREAEEAEKTRNELQERIDTIEGERKI